jgi:Tetratricopeptide repeat
MTEVHGRSSKPVGARSPLAPGGMPPAIAGALVATLALLLAHAWMYRFLCDDAFISFRYSVNLAHGHGLVFNPGMERVEGYSNFLWVMLLAGFDALGWVPESSALPLSLLCTVVMWAAIARFAIRQRGEGESWWPVIVPLLLLGATRSVWVWSTSGLETRFFEMFVVLGALALISEVGTLAASATAGRAAAPSSLAANPPRAGAKFPGSFAAWAFAFATLTRPDGLLLSCSAFGIAALYLLRRTPKALPRYIAGLIPFALLVGAHYAFRHAYYGDWFPNTYYAKVDGRTWWDSGFQYFAAFLIEYGAVLWLPLLVAGVLWNLRRGRALVPLVFAALVIPHAIYVASIGGDHFEYRPIDLYFPFVFLLMGDGARLFVAGRRAALALASLALVVVGLIDLPGQSHRQYPRHYITGFPGVPIRHDAEAQHFLDPDRDPIFRVPTLSPIAFALQSKLRTLTANFVGVRAEEHRMFLDTVIPEGKRIRSLIEQGVLPRDVYIAMGSVGGIPYYSQARVLDRVGLTDAHVAKSPVALQNGRRLMAHDKAATIEYARGRGVDLWTYDPVHLIVTTHSRRLLTAIRDAMVEGKDAWIAPLSDTDYVLCRLPMGIEHAAQRMPRLHFVAVTDSAFLASWSPVAEGEFAAAVARDSSDLQSLGQLAFIQLVRREFAAAAKSYETLLVSAPDSPEAWEYLGACRAQLGDLEGALDAMTRAQHQNQALGLAYESARVGAERDAIAQKLAARAHTVESNRHKH